MKKRFFQGFILLLAIGLFSACKTSAGVKRMRKTSNNCNCPSFSYNTTASAPYSPELRLIVSYE